MNVIANEITRKSEARIEIAIIGCSVFLSVIPNRGAGQRGRVRNPFNNWQHKIARGYLTLTTQGHRKGFDMTSTIATGSH